MCRDLHIRFSVHQILLARVSRTRRITWTPQRIPGPVSSCCRIALCALIIILFDPPIDNINSPSAIIMPGLETGQPVAGKQLVRCILFGGGLRERARARQGGMAEQCGTGTRRGLPRCLRHPRAQLVRCPRRLRTRLHGRPRVWHCAYARPVQPPGLALRLGLRWARACRCRCRTPPPARRREKRTAAT